MTERERFEEWADDQRLTPRRGWWQLPLIRVAGGEYADGIAQVTWEAWQAALQPSENPGATHWEGCALTGPKHYACLLREYHKALG